ncbi:N-acetylmuramoyl-L-alanine amidase [Desulfovibrio subterraneus]|uniref:N-acetylmuramoyl-L-alanine amidase n=1 Tax=Desulfovibrio subterraneus TaxID=2718620 RepID=A0A7J0BDJ8_9BACT|nr:N-acetylmuramoyl-L-alanine amidase [Desulfovibrio subterraneus]GFM31769.1 N-acetylmuramoyl-L-alanine amidase [Desulfovibrio subterraneus]
MSQTRLGRLTSIVIYSLCLLICLSSLAYGASVSADYKKGYDSFSALTKNAKRAKYRSNWKQLEESFMAIYKRDPKGAYAPKALYFAARVNEELGKRSFMPSDYQTAAEYYQRTVRLFPKHSWADDCLYRRAELLHEKLRDTDGAIADLNVILRDYTRGDMYNKALALHRELRKGGTPAVEAPPVVSRSAEKVSRPAVSSSSKASSSTPVSELSDIRFQSSNEYTRIVLTVSEQPTYHYQILPADKARGLPFRLYIDLMNVVRGNDVPSEIDVKDGILRQVRTGTPSNGATRVVLDFQSMQKYNVFVLDNPYRVVIDVTAPAGGTSVVTAPESGSKTASAPKKEAPKESAKSSAVAKYKAPPGSKKQVGELIEQLGLTVKTIMIDAGHGGKDPGANANQIREKDYVLKVATMVGEMLKQRGFTVLYTRRDDTFVPLEERTAMANVRKADMFLSFHINAHRSSGISGLETYYLNLASSKSAVRVAARENAVSEKRISDLQFILTDLMLNSKMQESKDLASLIQKNMVGTVKSGGYSVRDNGVRSAPFYVLMGAKMPSVLVELGYCTNKEEARRIRSDKYLKKLASGVVKGVESYTKQLGRYASM